MMVSPFTDWLNDVDIVSGDTVVVSSDTLPILLKSRELDLKFKPIDLIEAIQDKVSVNRTWPFQRLIGVSVEVSLLTSERVVLRQDPSHKKLYRCLDINGLSIPFIRFLFGENVSGICWINE